MLADRVVLVIKKKKHIYYCQFIVYYNYEKYGVITPSYIYNTF